MVANSSLVCSSNKQVCATKIGKGVGGGGGGGEGGLYKYIYFSSHIAFSHSTTEKWFQSHTARFDEKPTIGS